MNGTTAVTNATIRRARRAGSLSIAGALACLVLAPTIAHASQLTGDGGAAARSSSSDIDDVVAARKQEMVRDVARPATPRSAPAVRFVFALRDGCDIPQSLDDWSRRLIAVQVCSQARLVPASVRLLRADVLPTRRVI
jgi:hypothetical protein